jgi:CRISPR-associated exonuclease Cas4
MPLVNLSLGITGIADVVEFHGSAAGEQAFPVEYKRGRPKAHRADEVQLCAQALCLAPMLGRPVPEGALFYGETRRRKPVPFDPPLRELTLSTISATRALFESGRTPLAEYQSRRCDACSLIELCQPRLLGRRESVNHWLRQQIKD